eukprot:3939893-Rhodomonas_salina.1
MAPHCVLSPESPRSTHVVRNWPVRIPTQQTPGRTNSAHLNEDCPVRNLVSVGLPIEVVRKLPGDVKLAQVEVVWQSCLQVAKREPALVPSSIACCGV